MSDDFDTKGSIELNVVVRDVERAISNLGKYNEATGFADKSTVKLERDIAKASSTFAGNAAATNNAANGAKNLAKAQDSIISQRYALYDVATTYGAISAALLTSSIYAVKLGADFESAFTNVQRTSSGSLAEVEGLRDALVDLSTRVPLSFADLSKIATLGNQLGVEAKDIEAFTGTVARFAAVSGLSVEAAAQAFGRISNIMGIPIADAEKLGSAIELVGINSASTDQQIIALVERLGATATRAGFTADQVVGLAGALGSLGVAPERAQGVFETYFNSLNQSIAEGGASLESFARITGLTTDALNTMVRSGKGFEVFQKFLAGLQGADTVQLTSDLSDLGLTGLRANEVIGRISQNLPLLKSAFADAAQGYSQGTELSRQFALIVDDLNSQFQILINSINALITDLTGGLVPGLAGALGALTGFINILREAAANPFVAKAAQFAVVVSVLIGVMVALRAANALATASAYALATAQASIGGASALSGVKALISAVLGYSTVVDGAVVSTLTLKTAVQALGKATIVLAAVALAFELATDFKGAAKNLEALVPAVRDGEAALKKLGTTTVQVGGATYGVSDGMIRIGDSALTGAEVAMSALFPLFGLVNLLLGNFRALNGASTPKGVGPRGHSLSADTAAANDYSAALDGVGGSAADAAVEVRTLVDYADDLSKVFSRAFEIRFSGGQGLDAISTGWSSIKKEIAETNDQIAEYRATMMSLTADKAVKEYWLSVAENYGDVLRAGELRAELAELDVELTKNSKKLTSAQDKNTMTLTGNTDGAIENRAEILGLVTDYQSYIAALASSGLSQDQLLARTAQLKAEFIAQATQLGYNSTEVAVYAAAFDDLTFAILNVPRNITVNANVNPAIQALNEYLARVNASSASPSIGGGGGAAGAADGAAYANEFQAAAQAVVISRGYAGRRNIDLSLWNFGSPQGLSEWPFFDRGGYTGNGGVSDAAGVVHGKEFVFSAPAVKNIGVDNLAFAHRMAKRGYQNGGYVGNGGSGLGMSGGLPYVQLGPVERDMLQQIIDNAGVVLEPQALASATAGANANTSKRRAG